MKPIKKGDSRDLKIEIIKNKRKYLVAAMEFRRRKSEENEKKRKPRIKYATG